MFCEKCGSQLEEGARFCTKCGHPATQGASAEEITTAGNNAPTETNASIGTIIATETNTLVGAAQETSKQEQPPIDDSKKIILKGILIGIGVLIVTGSTIGPWIMEAVFSLLPKGRSRC